jgi:hypothetical protein
LVPKRFTSCCQNETAGMRGDKVERLSLGFGVAENSDGDEILLRDSHGHSPFHLDKRVSFERGGLTGGNTPLPYKRVRTSRQFDRARQETNQNPLLARAAFTTKAPIRQSAGERSRPRVYNASMQTAEDEYERRSQLRPRQSDSVCRMCRALAHDSQTSVTASRFRSRQIPPVA